MEGNRETKTSALGNLQTVGPLVEIKNTGGRAGLNMLTCLKCLGGHPSGHVYPRGQSFPTVVSQEEFTDVLHVDLLNSQGSTSSV